MIARAALLALAGLLAVSACGTGSESPAASRSSSAARPSAPPEQPRGAYGVTYEIQNWTEHADDPAVLAWKQIEEAISSAVNNDKLPDFVRDRVPAEILTNVEQNLDSARGRGFFNQKVAKVRIESAETTGDEAELVVCGWVPSTDLYQEDGTLYGQTGDAKTWRRTLVGMSAGPNGWAIASLEEDGTCPGAAPS